MSSSTNSQALLLRASEPAIHLIPSVQGVVVSPSFGPAQAGHIMWHTGRTENSPNDHPVVVLRQHEHSKVLVAMLTSLRGTRAEEKFSEHRNFPEMCLYFVPIKFHGNQRQADARPMLELKGDGVRMPKEGYVDLKKIYEVSVYALQRSLPEKWGDRVPDLQTFELRHDSVIKLMRHMKWLVDANIFPFFTPGIADSLAVRKAHLDLLFTVEEETPRSFNAMNFTANNIPPWVPRREKQRYFIVEDDEYGGLATELEESEDWEVPAGLSEEELEA
ncbi:hypothetical protein UCRNP2_5730 [Neofusicoccum parvum UCRNP2]|uniref:Uncharacterized protein n=1 Tax=Botryosphaeria parva (strain UCR-NP2) TaxID=1287680 RepID=R1G7P9_BOTPV|nr:hypothetical protein UCRNP2_5730 [Neofusicoccum parvum UCRNP2]